MDFLNPWFLMGTSAVTLPIIIHLLNRYRPRTVDWAAMEFLRRAMAVRSRQIRLQDLILLALRCLAILLIALAMSRPVIKPTGPKWLAGQSYAGVVIAIDGSYSMNHKGGVSSRFDKAIERTREILKTVEPGKPVSVVLMGNRTRTVLRNVGYDPSRFEQTLATLKPLSERLNVELCLEELAPLVLEIKAPLRECYLVSDAQATTWGGVSGKAAAEMKKITGDSRNRLYFVRASDESNENLAITNLSLASGTLFKNSVTRYVAHVRNYGSLPRENVSVKLLQDGVGVDVRIVESIGPGQTVAVELYTQFTRAGTIRLAAVLDEDPLLDDNSRFATAEVKDLVRVLCISGDTATRPEKSETLYLTMALTAKATAGKSPVEVRTVPRAQIASVRFDEYDMVVLSDIAGLESETLSALGDFVQRGGGLVIYPGRDVNAAAFNLAMKASKMPLLPAELQDPKGSETDRSKGWTIESSGADNPIARMVSLQSRERLAEGKVYRAFGLKLLPGGWPVLNFSGDEGCFLAERRVGRGKVLEFASSAGSSWSDLPLSPVYLMIVQQALTYVTRPPQEQLYTVGQPLTVALPRQTLDPTVSFRSAADQVSTVPVTPEPESGQFSATLPEARTQGFYEVSYAKDTAPLLAAVNVDTVESNVVSLKAEALRGALAGTPAEVLDDSADVMLAIKQKRLGRELWIYLMLLGLATMVTEAVLARIFSRKVHSGTADALPSKQRQGHLIRQEAA